MSLLAWVWLGFCLLWLAAYVQLMKAMLSVPLFEAQDPPEPDAWPALSVIVAARDEADAIATAAATLLAQNYPRLEVVLVNDRSRDDTGAVVVGLAAQDARVRAVHVADLPEGWLGKVHALHCGLEQARGDWLLFTDADVHFAPGALRQAVAYALNRGFDHLALMPQFHARPFWLAVAGAAFERMALTGGRVTALDKPDSDAFVGVGAFNLVRRETFARTPGFPWLKMEVVDDLGLGLMLRDGGARSGFAVAKRAISLEWYPSLAGMFRGLEKNFFAVAGYRPTRLLALLVFLWGLIVAPFAILFTATPWLWTLGAFILTLQAVSAWIWNRRFGEPLFPALLEPIGLLLVSLMLLRSGALCLWRDGVVWRDTHYPLAALRAGQRLKLPLLPWRRRAKRR